MERKSITLKDIKAGVHLRKLIDGVKYITLGNIDDKLFLQNTENHNIHYDTCDYTSAYELWDIKEVHIKKLKTGESLQDKINEIIDFINLNRG